MRALKQDGYRVPQQVALASLNDIPVAELVDPPLTTVAMPTNRLGAEAAGILLALINGDEPHPMQVMLPVELIVRQSCGCQE